MMYTTLPSQRLRCLLALLISPFFFIPNLYAQPISITTIVPEPAPIYWEDYLQFDSDVIFFATNSSTEVQEVKFLPVLTSDAGIRAELPPNFMPLTPIILEPGATRSFSFQSLRDFYGNVNRDDVLIEGVDLQAVYESETLPEGYYTLCVTAYDYLTNEPLSSDFGCDVFLIQQFEPPIIIKPYDEESIMALTPQFLTFLWSATGVPGRTRYRMQLFDQTSLGFNQSGDIFLNAAVLPYYEEEDLIANSLIYDQSRPPLETGHQYSLQITAYDPFEELVFKRAGKSLVHTFTYTEGLGLVNIDPVVNTGQPGGFTNTLPTTTLSTTACAPAPPPGPPIPYPTIASGMNVRLGHFELELININGQNPVSGSGKIALPLLNAIVDVNFTDLHINEQLNVYQAGDVALADDQSNLIPTALLNDFNNAIQPGDINETQAEQLVNYVESNQFYIQPAANNNPLEVSLPFGIEKNDLKLIITGMSFTMDGAQLNAIAAIDVPEAIGNRKILMGIKGHCLTQDDLGADGNLQLLGDQNFELSQGMSLTLLSGAEHTLLNWDEEGIQSLQLSGEVGFSSPLISAEGGAFQGTFNTSVQDFQNWQTEVQFSDNSFTLPGLSNFSFALQEGAVIYDHSDSQNQPGFELPPEHPLSGTPQLWQGIYFSGIDFNFPESIDASANLQDVIIDQSGLWVKASINTNILSFNEGDLQGWNFGIRGLQLDIQSSSLTNASFEGAIGLPISPDQLNYSTPIAADGDFTLSLNLNEMMDVPMWSADINFEDNSSIGVEKVGDDFIPTAILHGALNIGWGDGNQPQGGQAPDVSSFSLPGVTFSDLTISSNNGTPTISNGTIGFDLENVSQGLLNGFPLQFIDDDVDNPGLGLTVNNDNSLALNLNIGLALTESVNAFNASTAFSIHSKYNAASKKYRYDKTQLNALAISGDMGILSLNGQINIYSCDPTFGNGFDGSVGVNLDFLDYGIDMRLQVGRTECGNGFRYFYIDVMTKIPGIALGPTGLALYGLGGGFYYNMRRVDEVESDWNVDDFPNNEVQANNLGGGTGTSYLPDNDRFGFKASVVIGLIGTEHALNGDMTFQIELRKNFSVTNLWMDGNVYVMQPMNKHDAGDVENGIHGFAHIQMAFETSEFSLEAGVEFNALGGLAEGTATLDVFFSPDEWHIYLGKWTEGYNYDEDPNRINISSTLNFGVGQIQTVFTSYFMMGNDMQAGLPDKPEEIVNIFSEKGKFISNAVPVTSSGNTGLGFAFGVVKSFDLDYKGLIFYFDLEFLVGGDVLLRHYDANDCDQANFGFKNYYANGQAYAYMMIAGGVEGKLFGKKRKFEFASFEAAAALDVALPKPTWVKGKFMMKGKVLGGAIKFESNIDFEFGEKVNCRGDGDGGIFGDIPIVSDFDPRDGSKKNSIFTKPQVAFNFPNGPFKVEEDGNTAWYRYKIVNLKITQKKKGQANFENFDGEIQNTRYDSEGYSCVVPLSKQLPEESTIKFEIEVRGQKLNPQNKSQVLKNYDKQTYSTTFTTGVAPDYIVANSIGDSRPFDRQLYFFKQEDTNGYLSFWHEQSQNLFRSKPRPKDGLNTKGSYFYKARFIKVKNGGKIEVDLTEKNKDIVRFGIPGNLEPETIYELDIVRFYQPPAENDQNNTRKNYVDLNVLEDNSPPGASLGFVAVNNSSNNNQGLNGFSGLTQIASVQTVSGVGSSNFSAGVTDDDDDNPPFTPPGLGFAEPGRSIAGLERTDRSLKQRKKTVGVIAKSLMQKKFYFRTSKYNRQSEKLNTLKVKNDIDDKHSIYQVSSDDLYTIGENGVKADVRLPYIILESSESFDFFESQYYKLEKTFQDGSYSQNWSKEYTPSMEISGSSTWEYSTFYSTQDDGLFSTPFDNSDNAWCNTVFNNPDLPIGNENQLNTYHAAPQEFNFYIQQNQGPVDFLRDDRHNGKTPFGKRKDRVFPIPEVNYPSLTAYIEFVQWANPDQLTRPGLSGVSVRNTKQFLTNAVIEADLPGPSPGQFSGDLTFDLDHNLPATGYSLNPAFLQVGQSAQSSQSPSSSLPGLNVNLGSTLIALTDYTEWVTMQDYFLYRSAIFNGLEELLDMSNSNIDYPAQYNYDCESLPQPTQASFFEGSFEPSYNFYWRYYMPIQAYLKIRGSAVDYFTYPSRPADTYIFKIGNTPFPYTPKAYNNY